MGRKYKLILDTNIKNIIFLCFAIIRNANYMTDLININRGEHFNIILFFNIDDLVVKRIRDVLAIII